MNEELETKIEQTLAIIGSEGEYLLFNDQQFSYYSPVYAFTTENLKGYFDKLNFKGKSVLTVCGSGDQALNAILLGAKEVDTFDINELSFMFYKLKVAAIKCLSYDEYLDYFYDIDTQTIYIESLYNAYNKKIMKLYLKISPNLDEESRIFWDNLYLELNPCDIRLSNFFRMDIEAKETIIMMNNYLNTEENYYKLREMINQVNVNFINTDIALLNSKLQRKYDIILLSNIGQYFIRDSYGYASSRIDLMKEFRNLVIEMSNSLNPKGKIAANYLYDYIVKVPLIFCGLFYDKQIRKEVFFNDLKEENITGRFDYLTFDGISSLNNPNSSYKAKDGVLMYKKIN